MVYPPLEDSALLAAVVTEKARGKVLDVGTGSGVQALAAQQGAHVKSVEAVDIDPEAVAVARSKGVAVTQSDLFSSVEGKYDTIVCNAPYLPDEPLAPDVALDGGKRGFEWTVRFLEDCGQHLQADGHIYLLISTRTNPGIVEQWLIEHAYQFTIVSRKRVFMEELLVYDIMRALPDRPHAKFLAKGKRSKVYRDGAVVIKKAEPVVVLREAHMLQQVNALGIGPFYHSHDETSVVMDYVDGERIGKVWEHLDTIHARTLIEQILNQLRVLDAASINKEELTNPHKHIIVTADGPVLIDWERAKHTHRPHNVDQFLEYVKKIDQLHPNLALQEFL